MLQQGSSYRCCAVYGVGGLWLWDFARIAVWKTHSGEIWSESALQGLKENLIAIWVH